MDEHHFNCKIIESPYSQLHKHIKKPKKKKKMHTVTNSFYSILRNFGGLSLVKSQLYLLHQVHVKFIVDAVSSKYTFGSIKASSVRDRIFDGMSPDHP